MVPALKKLVARGLFEWELKDFAGWLPPGAWLKRLHPTGTSLDVAASDDYIHPLEALAAVNGRFDRSEERHGVEFLHKTRMTFSGACQIWGEGCGLTKAMAARWFYVFTPVFGYSPGITPLEQRLSGLAATVWNDLHLPGLHDTYRRQARAALKPPTDRPKFWTHEVYGL